MNNSYYNLSEAWSGVNRAGLMAAQGAFGTHFYDRSTRMIVGTMLWTEYRPVIKIGPKGALGSHEICPIHSAPSLLGRGIRTPPLPSKNKNTLFIELCRYLKVGPFLLTVSNATFQFRFLKRFSTLWLWLLLLVILEVWLSRSEPIIIRRPALVQQLSVRKDPRS